MLKNLLKRMFLGIVGFIALIVIIAALFISFSPQFGGTHSDEDRLRYAASENFNSEKFVNLIPTSMDMSVRKMPGIMKEFMFPPADRSPDLPMEINRVDSIDVVTQGDRTSLLWFGHSAFLLNLDGKRMLIDPMFGDVPAPLPFLGTKRYSDGLPIEIQKLPEIDFILISHDHYDHLDYGSIVKLKDKTAHFYVPMGLGAHLRAWGISDEKITEMKWWDETSASGLNLAFAPARHFSGRGVTDRNQTLWGSWIVKGSVDKIYFSGDGGYGPHFKEIGEKYGPFDFAMMECGQYNENWAQIHMMPEEAAQAALDVGAGKFMPIHWGAFTLALHSWTDPVERVTKKANELNANVVTPEIGEWIYLDGDNQYSDPWWLDK